MTWTLKRQYIPPHTFFVTVIAWVRAPSDRMRSARPGC
jgi:hypothetical protein